MDQLPVCWDYSPCYHTLLTWHFKKLYKWLFWRWDRVKNHCLVYSEGKLDVTLFTSVSVTTRSTMLSSASLTQTYRSPFSPISVSYLIPSNLGQCLPALVWRWLACSLDSHVSELSATGSWLLSPTQQGMSGLKTLLSSLIFLSPGLRKAKFRVYTPLQGQGLP